MTTTIGFVGFGNMAKALYEGYILAKPSSTTPFAFTRQNRALGEEDASHYQIPFYDIQALTQRADILILSFKPQNLKQFIKDTPESLFEGKTIVSLLAGVQLKTLEDCFPKSTIVRLMPNMAAKVSTSINLWAHHKPLPTAHKEVILDFINATGESVSIDESLFDLGTALFGSGPAFIYYLGNVFSSLLIEAGISPSEANNLVGQLLIGSGKMMKSASKTPKALAQDVMSKKGTTEAGIHQLTELNVSQHLSKAILAVAKRSQEISDELSG